MMVIDESFDCWRMGKNPHDYHVAYDDWWKRDLDSMVFRDRNHPSIIIWSVGNEVGERGGDSRGAKTARLLVDRVHENDPTRPVTAAMCDLWGAGSWSKTKPVFAALDIGGYNYQWKRYASDHKLHPNRIMMGTESTAGEAFDNWAQVMRFNHVIGDFVWTSLDYLGESGIGRVHYIKDNPSFCVDYPWHQANCGDLDLCGFKRPQSYYRDILWGNNQIYVVVHPLHPKGKKPIITYWGWPDVQPSWTWPGCENKKLKVDVYSACKNVTLYLNNKKIGTKPCTSKQKHIASFTVPYIPGELRAVGSSGKVQDKFILKTAQKPDHIGLTPDRREIKADRGSICYIAAEILDRNKVIHPAADRPIYFTVKGEGTVQAVGNANPKSTENYYGNFRSTFRGRCLAVVRSNGKPGNVILSAQADGLTSGELVIRTKKKLHKPRISLDLKGKTHCI